MARKPQRQLWEMNNYFAKFWGQPLEPAPVGGFAVEAPPPPSFAEVTGWFRNALPAHQTPSPKEIARIAKLVDEYRAQWQPRDVKREIEIENAHALQRVAAEFVRRQQRYLDSLLQNQTPGDPGVAWHVDLSNALRGWERYIGLPSMQGPQMPIWHLWARGLEEPVRSALRSAGAPASVKADAPLVRVVCSAAFAIEGVERTPEAVEAALKRWRRRLKGDAKI